MKYTIVKPNYRRRHTICRNMHKAGKPVWFIAFILRIPNARVREIIAGSTVWGAASKLLRQAVAAEERRAA